MFDELTNRAKIIAVTGSCGCGKSYVTSRLVELLTTTYEKKVKVFDYDARVKTVLRGSGVEKGQSGFDFALNHTFHEHGESEFGNDRDADKAWFRKTIIFGTQGKGKLDALVQPMMLAAFYVWYEEVAQDCDYVILDMPLLHEAVVSFPYDKSLCVVMADEAKQHQILLNRGLSEEEANELPKRHFAQSLKAWKSDFTLWNDTDKNPTNDLIKFVETIS